MVHHHEVCTYIMRVVRLLLGSSLVHFLLVVVNVNTDTRMSQDPSSVQRLLAQLQGSQAWRNAVVTPTAPLITSSTDHVPPSPSTSAWTSTSTSATASGPASVSVSDILARLKASSGNSALHPFPTSPRESSGLPRPLPQPLPLPFSSSDYASHATDADGGASVDVHTHAVTETGTRPATPPLDSYSPTTRAPHTTLPSSQASHATTSTSLQYSTPGIAFFGADEAWPREASGPSKDDSWGSLDRVPTPGSARAHSAAEREELGRMTFQQALPRIAQLSSDPAFLDALTVMKREQDDEENKLWMERLQIIKQQEARVKTAMTQYVHHLSFPTLMSIHGS
jgi:hypothetical protein